MKNYVIKIDDKYGDKCLKDSITPVTKSDRKPEGFVKIYDVKPDGSKKLIGKNNLVLYCGREWIASRLVNVANPNITKTPDQFISWFGLGDGGTPVGDPLNPSTPVNTDVGLSSEIPISSIDVDCADLRGADYYKHPIDTVEFEQDPVNEDKWLILKVTTTISVDDANGYNISEAGLYIATDDSGGHTGPFDIFSIVTFPTIVKDDSRQLMFIWYLYC